MPRITHTLATIALAAAPLALLAACSQPAGEEAAPPAPAPAAAAADPEAAIAAIDAVEASQLAGFTARDLDAVTAVYAPDATFFDAGSEPATGAEAIRAMFEGMLADENSAIELTRTGSWVSESGDLAVTQATYSFSFSGEDGAKTTVNGINQSVWKLQEDGSWKMESDFNGATE